MRVLIAPVRFEELCPVANRRLLDLGHELIYNSSTSPMMPLELETHIGSIDAAIVGMEEWGAALLTKAPKLKILAKLGVGLDNIDLEAARKSGIDVTNAPGGNARAVAEMALALMLAATRKIVTQNEAVRAGGWDRYTGSEISGKVVGLVGYGQTAQNLRQILTGFGTKVVAHDPYANPELAQQHSVQLTSLEDLVATSDFISVHIPHLPQTHHLLSTAEFKIMKQTAVLINTARGGVVDENALYSALVDGDIAAAGIDVWEQEPVSRQHPLLSLDNVVATAHSAADTHEAYEQVADLAVRAIGARLANKTPQNIQN